MKQASGRPPGRNDYGGINMGQEKYTQKTLEALQSAQQTAALHYHQEITSAHVLLALVKEPEGDAVDTYLQDRSKPERPQAAVQGITPQQPAPEARETRPAAAPASRCRCTSPEQPDPRRVDCTAWSAPAGLFSPVEAP